MTVLRTKQPKPWDNTRFDAVLAKKGMEIKRLEDVQTAHYKIKVQCLIDGYIWMTCPNSINKGKGCQKCAGLVRFTNDDVDKKIKNLKIKRLENYKNIDTPIKWQCLIEGHDNYIWCAIQYTIMKNIRGCPYCSKGSSERKIIPLIKEYVRNYSTFAIHKKIISTDRYFVVDFYLETNGKQIIIEYNREQHYMPTTFGNLNKDKANENFKNQIIRDEKLRKHCKTNNITLLEIPYYWKKDKIIEELLQLESIINNYQEVRSN